MKVKHAAHLAKGGFKCRFSSMKAEMVLNNQNHAMSRLFYIENWGEFYSCRGVSTYCFNFNFKMKSCKQRMHSSSGSKEFPSTPLAGER
jgi:hypothetical protein